MNIPTLPASIRTPAYVADVARLERNLDTARRIKEASGAKILLATKAFALPAVLPMFARVLDGSTASGEYEARLGREEFGKEVHVYAPAYLPGEVERLAAIADHIYFNSPEQLARGLEVLGPRSRRRQHVGLRVNPGYSNATLGGPLYDPCAPNSRFGTTPDRLGAIPWDEVDILHVHTLCESRHDGSVGLIRHVAATLAPFVRRVKAVNFGGGHFINKPDYDVAALIGAVRAFRSEFGVEVILEPGAGLVVDAGYLVATVLDLTTNGKTIAILDASASCHMPDVLEVPYTPPVFGATVVADGDAPRPHSYILAGKTCMTGDIIGEYVFPGPLAPGDRIVFGDMLQYSFVKNNTFNGQALPDLAVLERDGRYRVVASFGYEEFRRRLGSR